MGQIIEQPQSKSGRLHKPKYRFIRHHQIVKRLCQTKDTTLLFLSYIIVSYTESIVCIYCVSAAIVCLISNILGFIPIAALFITITITSWERLKTD